MNRRATLTRRPPRLAFAPAALLAFVAVAGLASAACPYPLGDFVARGDFVTHTWGNATVDPEWAIVEATLIHGQKSFGAVINAEGQLHFIYDDEVEYEMPDGGPAETQSIYYKKYSSTTGWDVPLADLAMPDTTEMIPDGRNVAPAAIAVGSTMWAVWEVSGSPRYGANGSFVVVRGVSPAGFEDIHQVAFPGEAGASKAPAITAVGTTTYIAFQTNNGQGDSLEFRLVGRAWDGRQFGPVESISGANDQWSDQSVSLASDGRRVFAAWVSQNTSYLVGDGDWVVNVAVRDENGTWGPTTTIQDSSRSRADRPSTAWHDGLLYVAWSSDDPALNSRGDFDVVMRSFDPPSLTAGPLLRISTSEFQGLDAHVSLYSWKGDGKLHILWTSASSPQSIATSGDDPDIYYSTFDGSGFGDIRLVSDPLDSGYVDALPGFFTVDDALHAFLLSNICLPGCGHETDWRQMTRLLERPARWYDGLTANYTMSAQWPAANGSAVASVSFFGADGAAVASDEFGVRSADGGYAKASRNGSVVDANFMFNDTVLSQFQGTYCGKPVPTALAEKPPAATQPRPSPAGDVVVPAILAAAALAAALGRRREGGSP